MKEGGGVGYIREALYGSGLDSVGLGDENILGAVLAITI